MEVIFFLPLMKNIKKQLKSISYPNAQGNNIGISEPFQG
jgi:hypothetical protein